MDSFCNDKKFDNFLEKIHSNGYNSNLSRNINNKVTTKNTNGGKFNFNFYINKKQINIIFKLFFF